MGCNCADKYWKQTVLPRSIYCLKNALPGTPLDPKKRGQCLFSLFLTLMNLSLVLPLIFTWQTPQSHGYLPVHLVLAVTRRPTWSGFRGPPSDLPENPMAEAPPFWLLLLPFPLELLPKWSQRGSSLSSLSSESSNGCICSVDIIEGGVSSPALRKHKKQAYYCVLCSFVHLWSKYIYWALTIVFSI